MKTLELYQMSLSAENQGIPVDWKAVAGKMAQAESYRLSEEQKAAEEEEGDGTNGES